MLNLSIYSLVKSLIFCFCLFIRQNSSKEISNGLNKVQISQVLYHHNIFRYLVAVGNVKSQPTASDMSLIRWNQSLEMSLNSIPTECIVNRNLYSCPPINVYRIKNPKFEISRIVRAWFNINRHYDYSMDYCTRTTCDFYKQVVGSKITSVACSIKPIGSRSFFICQYGQRLAGRPYKVGAPCSYCENNHNCYKGSFCVTKRECSDEQCDHLMTQESDDVMQGDQPQFCRVSTVNCDISFFRHMCSQICSSSVASTTSTTISTAPTTKMKMSDENEVCNVESIDCSITFFKILCPKTCEGVLCRDPNIDCKNIFYANCKKCRLVNETMSDSRITSTTMTSSLEQVMGLIDPKCQDLPYDNYCLDRGEMCFHVDYEAWMKKFCCNTCTVLNMCFDYLEIKNPGKCSTIQSSGMCSALWSQTYCRKTCKQC